MRGPLLATALLACASAASAAGGGEPFDLQATREAYGTIERQRITVSEKDVRIARDSNFLCDPQTRVFLGAMSAPATPEREPWMGHARVLWGRFRNRAQALGMETASHETNPHEVRLELGGVDLTGNPIYGSTLIGIHQRPCGETDWEPIDGLQVSVTGGDTVELVEFKERKAGEARRAKLEDFKCRSIDKKSRDCEFPPWGRARLRLSSQEAK